jgi:hypothetical protein
LPIAVVLSTLPYSLSDSLFSNQPESLQTLMKTFSWSLPTLFLSITMISLSGCSGEPKPAAMTEGVPLSEIEAYEQEVLAMETEDAGEMEIDENEPAPAAE